MQTSIEQLKNDMTNAKSRQAESTRDIKRIERDMKDFDNDKDSKLAELQSSAESLRKAHQKASTAVKSLQKELQSARLEVEQTGGDQGAAQEQLEEIDSSLQAQERDMNALQEEQTRLKVLQS